MLYGFSVALEWRGMLYIVLECLYCVLVWLCNIRVNCARNQTWNPASLAQAGPSRLSESCRVAHWVLVRDFSSRRPRRGLSDMVSRLGKRHSQKRVREENLEVWARFLAQARGFGVLSDWHSRLGENGSPKRVFKVCSCVFCWILV